MDAGVGDQAAGVEGRVADGDEGGAGILEGGEGGGGDIIDFTVDGVGAEEGFDDAQTGPGQGPGGKVATVVGIGVADAPGGGGVERVVAGDGGEHFGGVGDGAGQRAGGILGKGVGDEAGAAHEAEGGPQADQAAGRGRRAHRVDGVAAEAGEAIAGSQAGAGAAAGAAGAAGEVVGVNTKIVSTTRTFVIKPATKHLLQMLILKK